MKKATKLLALLLALLMVLTACGQEKTPDVKTEEPVNTAFEPKLNTEKTVELKAGVFFGNFEAFDQVINHFNEFYPNVTITYDAIGDSSDPDFWKNNPNLDIFMTSAERGYSAEGCVDLLEAGVDFSAVADGLLASNTVDGKVLALPMGLMLKGIVVNRALLENEGLTMPRTWAEFLGVLEALKEKGYTPIQGPDAAMGDLVYSMGMAMLQNDPALCKAAADGDAAGAAALEIVYDRLLELYDKGYISHEVNAGYPENNYDGAILKFFEGDVPFWVCDTEKVSGMKKRESKSEAFSANPFTYEFTFAPMGDDGVYEYIEPWYGFAVNKAGGNSDYAAEFLRFMAREDELNTLASVKDVPSIAKNAPDERYANLSAIETIQLSTIDDGTVPAYYGTLLLHTVGDMLTSGAHDADTALTDFMGRCSGNTTAE